MQIKNAKVEARRYFGLHMSPGVAEYTDPDTNENYRIFLNENVIKTMDPTFSGKPVYVRHVDKVDHEQADGVVVRSFFNQADGKHWSEFMVQTEEGIDAIENKGWRLSNAYHPREFAAGGKWHNVDFTKEVTQGEYEHLAIVPNPRYDESVIYTPEEFRLYNERKEAELKKFHNDLGYDVECTACTWTGKKSEATKGCPKCGRKDTIKQKFYKVGNKKDDVKKPKGESSMLKFWNRTKMENSADLENATIELPNGKETTLAKLVNENEALTKKNDELTATAAPAADGAAKIQVGDAQMTLEELVAAYLALKSGPAADAGTMENEDTDEEKKKKADKEKADKKENDLKAAKGQEHFDALKNAGPILNDANAPVDFTSDQIARGKARYGSK